MGPSSFGRVGAYAEQGKGGSGHAVLSANTANFGKLSAVRSVLTL